MTGSLPPPDGAPTEGGGAAASEATGPPAAGTTGTARPIARERQAFLPSDVDPTVFDEGFLRQLERLLVMMRSPSGVGSRAAGAA